MDEHGHAASNLGAPWPGAAQVATAPSPTLSLQPGFVMPGIASGTDMQPLGAHDGMIGTAVASPVVPGPYGGPSIDGGGQFVPTGQPQAWAFPAPGGLRLVQPGATAPLIATTPAPLVATGGQVVRTRRRIRWETIVPALAVLCLAAAVCFFIHDFDHITGRSSSASHGGDDAATAVAGGDEAASAGGGAASAGTPPPVTTPANGKRKQPVAKRTGKAEPKARSTKPRTSTPTTRPATRPKAAPSRPTSNGTPTGHAPAPPGAATGGGGAKPAGRPPTAASSGKPPARPNVPNPTGATGGGAGAVGAAPASGGTAANCTWMEHDGQSMCM